MRRRPFRGGRSDGRTVAPFVVLVLLSVGPTVRLSAQDAPVNAGALFLAFPVGAQAAAMGQAGSGLAGRGEAAFWNPAGLAALELAEVGVHSATLAAGRTHAVTAYFPSARLGVFGGAVYLVDYGDLESTDSSGNTIARISPRNIEFLASYATSLSGPVRLGLSYKLVQFRVDCSGDCRDFPNGLGMTHAVDVGAQVFVGPSDVLRVGIALRNVGFRLQVQNREQADALPAQLAVGAVYRLALAPFPGAVDGERVDVRVAADVNSSWSGQGGQAPELRLGADLGYRDLLRLRGGYAFVHDGLSGASIGVGVTSGSIGVDLAQTFLTGSDLVAANPTFFSFRVVF